jgi:hypothetical protein
MSAEHFWAPLQDAPLDVQEDGNNLIIGTGHKSAEESWTDHAR